MSSETSTDLAPQVCSDVCWCRDHAGRQYDYGESLELIRSFHGYPAPGLVLGVKMVTFALDQLPEKILYDAICETSSCLPDAVQILTLCTIGNAWLKVVDLGKFAVTLYDKFTGSGIRVFLDPAKLSQWSEYYNWFYKLKSKKEQNNDQLYREIQIADRSVLTALKVQVAPQYLVKKSKGRIITCPKCKEAFPAKDGRICKGCQGQSPYSFPVINDHTQNANDLKIKVVPLKQAGGKRILHDMTRIISGKEKGPAFKRGQVISAGDICRLQQMGRDSVYIEDENNQTDGFIHENEAAIAFAGAMSGEGVTFMEHPSEGKITMSAERDGLLDVDVRLLRDFNQINGVMCASEKRFTVVCKGQSLAATRAIPLFLDKFDFTRAMALLINGPIFTVIPMRKAKVGILITGTEVFNGVITDSFIPIIQSKVLRYGGSILETMIVPDDRELIRDGVEKMVHSGIDLLVTTAGLSVDPDDVTRQGLVDAGCTDMLYGAPILPGAMTLLAKNKNVQILGVPACGLYYTTTSLDILLPRLLANQTISRADISNYGHGGFCRGCKTCTFPNCSFGK